MIECPNCGAVLSGSAVDCPVCHAEQISIPQSTFNTKLLLFIGFLVASLVIFVMVVSRF